MLRTIAQCLWLAQGLLVPLITAAGHAKGFVPDFVLHVSLAEINVACSTRMSVVVNGTSPGPAIHLPAGKTSWIRVYNDMPDTNFTMHWHGLAQKMAPFSDGSPLAAQWPMKGHTFFDYEIRPDAEAPGSFFYHAHVGLQALTAFGPLIVDDCLAPPYQYDEERVLVFSDYFAATDEVLESGLESVPFKWTGETAGVLLNGQGVGVNQTAKPGPPARQADDANTICTLPVIDVDPGKTYRFRFIGGTGLSLLTMALEDHGNLTIIQVDGGDYLQPASTDHVQLGSGQRFDVLFKAKSAEELQATDKATFYLQFETRDRPKTLVSYGVLRYKAHLPVPTGPQQPIFTLPTAMGGWMEYTFRALRPQDNVAPTATEVTRRVVLDMVQKVNETTGRVVWEMAHLSWAEDMYANRVPALVDIYLRGDAAVPDYDVALKNYGWDPSTLSYPARVGEVLEIVLQNTGSEANLGEVDSHSFHAHGQHVFDLGQGPGLYDADANEAKMKATGYLPIMRDTTVLYRDAAKMQTAGQPAGWRAWRIRVDDPGVWLIHCHTLAHMMMGMQSVWVVGSASEIMSIPSEEASGYLTFGGNVLGNDTSDPQVVEHFHGVSSALCPTIIHGGPP